MLKAFAGGTVFGESYGEHPARVLALHGWRRTHVDFAEILTGGTGGVIDAIALDLPGFGASPPPPAAWGSADYARAIVPVLDEMADRPVVLGHSFGGRVALELAVLVPERLSALVLTGVPLLPPLRSARPRLGYRIIRGLARARLVSAAQLERARRNYGSEDYRAAEGVMRDVLVRVLGERYEKAIAQVPLPVTLVWGEHDTAAPLERARTAERMFQDAEFVEIAGGHHLTPTESPGVLRHAVLRRLG